MKTKFFFFLAMLLMSSVGAFAQSETNTPLEGDLNHDGKVDAADITYLVNIILKKTNEPVEGDFWYFGNDIDNAGAPGDGPIYDSSDESFGWHYLDTSVDRIAIPYMDMSPDRKHIHYAMPVASGFNDIVNANNTSQLYGFNISTQIINGVEYNIYKTKEEYKRLNGFYFIKSGTTPVIP